MNWWKKKGRDYPNCAAECRALSDVRSEMKLVREEMAHARADYHLVREELRAYHEIVMLALGLEPKTPTPKGHK